MPKSAGDGWKTMRREPRVPSCMLENPARVEASLSLRRAVAHGPLQKFVGCSDSHRMEGVTRMEDILCAVRRALLHRKSHFPAPSCSRCGVAAYCRATTPASALTEALQLVEHACCRQCVGWWSFEILEFGAKDFNLPGWFFHNPQPKLNNSLELFAAALLLPTLNYYHSCSLMWSCFFMWLLHHEKKNTPPCNVVFAVLEIQNQGGEDWLNLQPIW